jgi:hypothetical protein
MNLVTSSQILKLLEDFAPSDYPVGNISGHTYVRKSEIIDLIYNKPGFAEKVLLQLLKTDYSYLISGDFNPVLNTISAKLDSNMTPTTIELKNLKNSLSDAFIDVVVEVVNFYKIS